MIEPTSGNEYPLLFLELKDGSSNFLPEIAAILAPCRSCSGYRAIRRDINIQDDVSMFCAFSRRKPKVVGWQMHMPTHLLDFNSASEHYMHPTVLP
jgi:hypothetical protein